MSTIPLRVNLRVFYRWSHQAREYSQFCQGPVGYGAMAEVYTPRSESGPHETEAEAFLAADDYCNALADRQEQGDFTIYAMYPVCGDCAARLIAEEVGGIYPVMLVADARARPQKDLRMAVCLLYEPGAYGKSQSFVVHSYVPTSLEMIYGIAKQNQIRDEAHFELRPHPGDEPHAKSKRKR